MINVINVDALKNYSGPIALSELTSAHFGYAGDVQRLPVERAYREVGWYRRGLDLRANGVSMMPFDLLKGDTVVFDEQSNDEDLPEVLNIFPLLAQMVRDLDKHGACYAVFETDVCGYKKEWRRLHPTSIYPRYNATTRELLYFERMYGTRENPQKYRFELDELLWLWMPADSGENMPGAGVGFTALLAATGLANKDKFEAYYYEHGAINPTLVKVKGFANLPKDEKDRVMNVFQKMMAGIRNAFKITPIDGDVEVFNLMSSLKDMAMDKSTTQQREDIATTLGVPQTILFSNAANYATAAQDDFHFYDKTIAPFCGEVLAPQLNKQLFKRGGYQLKFRKNRLEVYQKMEVDKAYAAAPMFDRGIFSANQILDMMSMEPFEEDWYRDLSVTVQSEDEINPASVRSDSLEAGEEAQKLLSATNPTPDPSPLQQGGEVKSPVIEDVGKWERMALKRWKEGTPEKALEFESDVIPAGLRGAIKGGLDVAEGVDDVRMIFADAGKYLEHDRE